MSGVLTNTDMSNNKEQLFLEIEGLSVEVKVVDEKIEFGYKLNLVIPVAGSGEKWVRQSSLLKPARRGLVEKIK